MLKNRRDSMKIKMCGITTPADVAAVNEVRPDYIGMVMYFPKSKRNVSVETARRLLEELRKDVKKVAVVVSPDAEQIAEIGELGFDVIQIHGQTSDELIESAHLPVWKAFNVKDMDMYPHYQSLSNVAGYVFDAGEPGSGKTFDWNSYGIGERELEITALVAEGLSNKEISEKVCLSEGTVRNYISNVLEKLELRDRTQLAVYYLQRSKKMR